MGGKKGLWLPCRLRRTQICTDDLGRRVLVSEFNGPDTGAASDVENPAWFITNGSQVEFVADGDFEHLMYDIEAVEFAL